MLALLLYSSAVLGFRKDCLVFNQLHPAAETGGDEMSNDLQLVEDATDDMRLFKFNTCVDDDDNVVGAQFTLKSDDT